MVVRGKYIDADSDTGCHREIDRWRVTRGVTGR